MDLSSFLLLVVWPGASSSVLAPSSDALAPSSDALAPSSFLCLAARNEVSQMIDGLALNKLNIDTVHLNLFLQA